MVVDDIRINRLIAQRFLLAHGATVDLAEDGKAGLEAVASAQPPYDVVLMDCQMPVLDGVSTILYSSLVFQEAFTYCATLLCLYSTPRLVPSVPCLTLREPSSQ